MGEASTLRYAFRESTPSRQSVTLSHWNNFKPGIIPLAPESSMGVLQADLMDRAFQKSGAAIGGPEQSSRYRRPSEDLS